MIRRIALTLLLCMTAAVARAQNTTVTATITDPNSVPYAFSTGYAALVCPGNQAPTYNGYTVPRTFTITGFNGNGTFTQVVYDVGLILPVGCGYQWHITYKDGVTNFITGTITSVTGASVNESAAISAYSVLLPGGSGSGTITGCTTAGGIAFENGTANALTCTPGFSFGAGQFNIPGFTIATNIATGGAVGSGNVYTLASAGNASAGLTTYTGTLGAATITVGMYVTVAGFTNGVNNGRFIVQAINTGGGTVTLYNASGTAESHAATATVDNFYSSPGLIESAQARSFQYGQPGIVNFPIRGTNYNLSAFNATQPNSVSYAAGLDGDATDAYYTLIVNNGATGDHGVEIGAITDGTGANPTALHLGHFGGTSGVFSSIANGTFFPFPQTICSGQIALSTGAISSGTRATNTLSCSGLSATTDSISCTFSGDTNAVTGYAPSASGGLTLKTWASTNTINVDQVNDTSGSITPGAATVNCKGIR